MSRRSFKRRIKSALSKNILISKNTQSQGVCNFSTNATEEAVCDGLNITKTNNKQSETVVDNCQIDCDFQLSILIFFFKIFKSKIFYFIIQFNVILVDFQWQFH